MPTHENNDQLFDMDFDAAKNLPRNPYTNKVSPPIQDPMGNPPDYAALSGPHYEGSFSPPAADSPPKVETEGGFPEPVASEYGDEKLEQPLQAQSQGTITTPVVPPVPLETLPGYSRHRRMYFQNEQANKTPDNFDTQNLTVPPVPGTAYQIAGRNRDRDEFIILNTGTNTVYFARTEDRALAGQGFPISPSASFKLGAQAPIYLWCDNNEQTTVATVETTFEQYVTADGMKVQRNGK